MLVFVCVWNMKQIKELISSVRVFVYNIIKAAECFLICESVDLSGDFSHIKL